MPGKKVPHSKGSEDAAADPAPDGDDQEASQPHDGLVRRLLGPPRDAAAYLASALPPAVVARVDWPSLQLRDGHFVEPDLRRHHTDLLFEARIDGRPGLIYLLLEHQSSIDPLMPVRVLIYLGRVWSRWIRSQESDPKRVPPLIPLVLYHGQKQWTAPTRLTEVLDLQPEALEALRPHLPELEIRLDDLTAQQDEALHQRAVGAAIKLMLLSLKHVRETDDLEQLIQDLGPLLLEVLRSPNGLEAISAIIRYIRAVRGALPRGAFAAALNAPADDAPTHDNQCRRT